ncbi:putative integral membrane protein [Desulfocapsa sulfexigens DSM 10523]|uniref:Putative integral membrane protein n=1 Tax=Desulfocapsa sulfexigens (strain DSM 10523 / SB164P1) TaxID=1167006 RepID=M1NK35_DESSD|nr:VanZ family protein [Desulfocapsa sulfexigens]AGF79949.1 putative integral membrane protein [Desulfocapsa sulfexigens DSM 10523]
MVIIMGTIFFLSHQSGDTLQLPTFPGADKLAHMTAYGVLALTVLWFYGDKGLKNPVRNALVAVLFCLFYGISDEFHQSFIAFRDVSIYDLLADTAGALCSSLVWLVNPALQQKILSFQNGLLSRFQSP